MAKTNKIAKLKKKASDAVETILQKINAPSSAVESDNNGPLITITKFYIIKKIGNDVTFSLVINTKGAGALTDATLHKPSVNDKIILSGAKDNQVNISVDKDTNLDVATLNVRSVVTATNLTPVPVPLAVVFSMSGGQADETFPIPARQFNNVGDVFILDFSITIFQS